MPVDLAESECVSDLVWLHGGDFVGGDKEQMLEFATYVTAQTGLAVLCLNYDLAPKAKYPSQSAQLNEAVQHSQTKPNLVNLSDLALIVRWRLSWRTNCRAVCLDSDERKLSSSLRLFC